MVSVWCGIVGQFFYIFFGCSTYCCQDCGREENSLDVIPVRAEALTDRVDVVLDGVVDDQLIVGQQPLHLLLEVQAANSQVAHRSQEALSSGDKLGLRG